MKSYNKDKKTKLQDLQVGKNYLAEKGLLQYENI
jgi:hypothetical protein